MKTKIASLFVVILIATTQCLAQNKITVEAENNDISNNLDLKAVATAFGESKNLEEFEQKLNDYNSGISNLDLNNDGQVDYLRVIEQNENDIHVVVIQAVLGEDSYQDVASIVVERDQNSKTSVQVIGDPYLYGDNYIIEPDYLYTPSIFSFFWGSGYYEWNSPYYWGYYPSYYRYRRPFELGIYLSNIYSRINHNQRYYYTNHIRDQRAEMLHNSLRRNDYGVRHPDRTFNSRNENMRNKRDFEFNRNGVIHNQSRQSYPGNSNETRPTRAIDNSNGSRNIQSNGWNQRNQNQRIYSTPYDSRNMNNSGNEKTYQNYTPQMNRNSNVNNGIQRNNAYQPNRNFNNGNNNSVNRLNGGNRNNPQVSQPVRNTVSKPSVQSQPQNTRSNEVKSENRSSNNESNRR